MSILRNKKEFLVHLFQCKIFQNLKGPQSHPLGVRPLESNYRAL
jgi:hypothetical protein